MNYIKAYDEDYELLKHPSMEDYRMKVYAIEDTPPVCVVLTDIRCDFTHTREYNKDFLKIRSE